MAALISRRARKPAIGAAAGTIRSRAAARRADPACRRVAVHRVDGDGVSLAITETWHGRAGSVILGPTEARVARYLESATRHGRVTIRTVDLASRLQLERSE